MSDGALTVLDGSHLRAVDLSLPDSDVTLTGAHVLDLADSKASSSLFGLTLPQGLKSSALKRLNVQDDDVFRQAELDRHQALKLAGDYIAAIADELKDDPIVISILDGNTIRLFLEDEDDFAMLAENLFTDLDAEDVGKLNKSVIQSALLHMGVEMGVPPVSEFPPLSDILTKHGAYGEEELGQAQFAELLQPILQELAEALAKKNVVLIQNIKIVNGSKLRKLLADEKQINSVIEKILQGKKDGLGSAEVIRSYLEKNELELGLPPSEGNEPAAILYDLVFTELEQDKSTLKEGEDNFGNLVKKILEKKEASNLGEIMSMIIEPSRSSPVPQIAMPEIVRPIANFQPSIWGDQFLNYDSQDIKTEALWQQQVEELKVKVKSEVFTNEGDFALRLKLIDAIQRLGVAYQFEEEIEDALRHIHATYRDQDQFNDDSDLPTVALCFRLLRQHGYEISSDIFNKFKDENGSFIEGLVADGCAMLSLYEAAHLRVHGENILEEALVFTTNHLESAKSSACYSAQMTEQITQALARPLRTSLERICAKRHMSVYQLEDDAALVKHHETLLKLAKMDFNLVQFLHKKELCEITRWWKELDFERKLPFARDRKVELFFWIVGVYFEPQYSTGRIFMTKVAILLTVMDDIYDAYIWYI